MDNATDHAAASNISSSDHAGAVMRNAAVAATPPDTSSSSRAESSMTNSTATSATSSSAISASDRTEVTMENATAPDTSSSDLPTPESAGDVTNNATIPAPLTRQALAEDREFQKILELKWNNENFKRKVGGHLVRIKKKLGEDAKLAQETVDGIPEVLDDLGRIRVIRESLVKATNLRSTLETWKDPGKAASDATRSIVGGLFDKFDDQGWGTHATSNNQPPASPSQSNSTSIVPAPRRGNDQNRLAGTIVSALTSQPAFQSGVMRLIDPRNRIWGPHGIMHDFQMKPKNPKGFYISVVPGKKKNAKRFGRNGLQIGQCWAYQAAAFRDGAHGSYQGGIHGTIDGAYSVITVDSKYEALERDYGDKLEYVGSGAVDEEQSDEVTKNTAALRKSIQTQNPVRVIRGTQKTPGPYSPKVGYRYDGLYKVKREVVRKHEGKKYVVFVMEREAGQPAIALNQPEPRLQRQIEQAKLDLQTARGWTV